MKKEEAIPLILENLTTNVREAKTKYEWASQSVDPELQYGAGPEWFRKRMVEYQHAESTLRHGDTRPTLTLLNSLIASTRRMGLDQDMLRQGKFPLICLRDALYGIDTPTLPEPVRRTTPAKKKPWHWRVVDRILGF